LIGDAGCLERGGTYPSSGGSNGKQRPRSSVVRVSDTTVRVAALPVTGRDVERWCEIYATGRAAEAGGVADAAALVARIRGEAGDPHVAHVGAWSDRRLLGVAEVRADAKSEAFTRIYVGADHRRAGIGRALADAVIAWAAGHGCRRLRATIVAGSAGEPFAESLGASIAIRLVTVVRDLDAPAPAVRHPSGVRLLRWRNHVPDELLDAYAVLCRAVGDAPDARMQIDVEARTPHWVRQWERARTAAGNDLWVSAALDARSGAPVAFTEVEVPAAGNADQHDTAVLASWRGRGLATWLKADMIDRMRADRPDVTSVTSTINERNVAMLRVCAVVGFREAHRRHLVALDVAPR
jgi:GNAT superfamily N-acetyltransferase